MNSFSRIISAVLLFTLCESAFAQFSEQYSGSITGVKSSSVAWGDYDNDGDLDLLVAGLDGSGSSTRLYQNTGSGFTEVFSGNLTGIYYASVAWGDYDNDGKLDILIMGDEFIGGFDWQRTKIYRNTGSGFTEVYSGSLQVMERGSAAWGDYDNDGRIDLILTGGYHSTIYHNTGSGFTAAYNFVGLTNSSVAWGDYDNDGDLDFILTGIDASNFRYADVYENTGTGFTKKYSLTGIDLGAAAWGDYDNDGKLDIVLAGNFGSKIYHNTGSGFTEVYSGSLPGIAYGAPLWGDYDNDGDLDILITGMESNGNRLSRIYKNTGTGFTQDTTVTLTGVRDGRAAWGDYDNDGDLDIALVGADAGLNPIAKIYRNDGSVFNTAPSTPAGLTASVSEDSVQLSWTGSTDSETPSAGLSYNLRMGNSSGGINTFSPMSDSATGYRRLPQIGNTDHDTAWTAKSLAGGTYYWSVQTVDNAFAGSTFSTEGSFHVLDRPPTVGASGVTFSAVATDSFRVHWTNGNGSSRIVVIKSGSPVDSDPVDGSSYTADANFGSGIQLGSGNYVVYQGTDDSITVTGLSPATTYYVAVYEFNGSAGTENYVASPATSSRTTVYAEPTVQASNVQFSSVGVNSMTVSWTNGNGSSRIVLMKPNSAVDASPSDTIGYSANTVLGSGSEIGSGNYVVYSGTGNSVTVSGLSGGRTYHVAVYEYNGPSASENYLVTTPATGNTSTAIPTLSTDRGSAVAFDGSTQYVSVPDDYKLRLTDNFTLEAWVYPTKASDNTVIDKGAYGYLFSVRPNGTSGLGFYLPATSTWLYSGGTVPLNEWSHVAIVFQTGTNGVRFYLNGNLLGEQTASGVLTANTGPVNIGRQAPGNCDCNLFQGLMDEVRVWDIARSAQQIREHMHFYPDSITGLVAYWQLNDGSGTTAIDLVSQMNGTLEGGSTWSSSTIPFAAGTDTTVSSFTSGTATLGTISLTATDGFDTPVDLYAAELADTANVLPSGGSAMLDDRYWVLSAFGTPGTFSTNLTFTVPSAFLSSGASYTLYHRSSSSDGAWSPAASSSSTGAQSVSFNGINTFSQFVIGKTYEPTTQTSGVTISDLSPNAMTVHWTNGNGASRVVVVRQNGAVNSDPVDGTSYTGGIFPTGTQVGSGNYVVYNGTADSVRLTGLASFSTYYVAVYEYNGSAGAENYLTASPATVNQLAGAPEPTVQTSGLIFSSVTPTSVTISWTKGNGARRIVKMSPLNMATGTVPSDGTTYSADSAFGGGTQIASGNYIVYADTGSSVTVTGLTSGIYYAAYVFEFNGTGGMQNYLTSSPAAGQFSTLSAEPVQAASNMVISSVTPTSMNVSWQYGDGTYRMLVAKAGSPITGAPADGFAYNFDSTYGGPQMTLGTYVVYNGTARSVTVSGLSPSTVYYFAVFEYNTSGSNSSTNYLATPATGSRTTLATEPTVQTSGVTFSSVTTNSMTVKWTNGNGASRLVLMSLGVPVNQNPVDGTGYTADSVYSHGYGLNLGEYAVYAGAGDSVTVTGLLSDVPYYVAVYELNGSSGAENYLTASPATGSRRTLAAEPTVQSSNVTFSSVTASSMTVFWAAGNGSARIVLVKAGSAVDADPVDQAGYTANAAFGSGSQIGSGNFVVSSSTATGVTLAGLSPSTTYHVAVYEYNGSDTSANYLLTSPARASRSTLAAQPSVQASNASADSATSSSMSLRWTNGNGANRIVLMRAGLLGPTTPVDGVTYTANAVFGSGSTVGGNIYVVYSGTDSSVAVTGLSASTTYYAGVFEYNGTGGNENYLAASPATASLKTMSAEPTVQASAVTFSSVTGSSIALNWTAGNGDYRLVVVKSGNPVDGVPVDGTTYSASSNFGSGSQIGSGNYVAYGGGGSSATISGLSSSTVYYIAVYEFKGYNGDENYLTVSPATGNQRTAYFSQQLSNLLSGVYATALSWGDYDNDGDLDILAVGSPSKILRNDGGSFTEVYSGSLESIYSGSGAWGDYDNDGNLDILLVGSGFSKIYRNTGSGFTEVYAGSLKALQSGTCAWGDFDNDGLPDIVLAGSDGTKNITSIYRNTGSGFAEIYSGMLTGIYNGFISVGDYDNDGLLDILLTGTTNTSNISRIYRNTGSGFTEVYAGTIPGTSSGSALWGDYDNDGDLDILLSSPVRVYQNTGSGFTQVFTASSTYGSCVWGDFNNDGKLDFMAAATGTDKLTLYQNTGSGFADGGTVDGYDYPVLAQGDYDNDGDLDVLLAGQDFNSSAVSRVYRNDISITNSAPNSPSGLGSGVSGAEVTLSWSAATDAQTPSGGLSYNLRVGTGSGGSDIVSPMANDTTGTRRVSGPGNVGQRTSWTLKNLNPGTYYWSVQAIDQGFSGSAFASEGSFAIVVVEPTVQASSVSFSSTGSSTVTLNWINGNGSSRIVLAKADTAVNSSPSDGTGYSASSVFGSGSQIGTGNYVVYSGTGNSATVAGLSPLTAYHFAVFELAGSGATADYFVTSPARGDTTTSNFGEQFAGNFPGVQYGSSAWGDYDNDGDLDLLLTGYDSTSSPVSKIYQNTGSGFTEVYGGSLLGVGYSSVAWGDYDNDGRLDILLTGYNSDGIPTSKIYHNTGSGFSELLPDSLSGVYSGSVAWGDYDNDGRLDILLTGTDVNYIPISKIYHNTGSGFSELLPDSLDGVYSGSAAWGDYDNDGKLDILLTGYDVNGLASKIYHNTGSGFTEVYAGSITGVGNSSAAWGDYDNDGKIDILLTGYDGSTYVSKIYQNTGTGFSEVYSGNLEGMGYGSVAWGDYDNDGKSDILLSGDNTSGYVSRIYRNTGTGFTEVFSGALTDVGQGSASWADFNHDGDLDILLTGSSTGGGVARLYRNFNPTHNTAPGAPTGLNAAVTSDTVALSWTKATDTQTAQDGLTYNLRIGTASGRLNTLSPMSDSSSGFRRITRDGNADHANSWTITNLDPGTYYWSVQAVDNAFAGSAFAAEGTFTITGALPVQMAEFVAEGGARNAELRWKTETEVDNYGFDVERRSVASSESRVTSSEPGTPNPKPGTIWSAVGFVKGSGTSTSPKEYSFSDKKLSPARYAYRIKQIDKNGSFRYTDAVEVEVGFAPKVFGLSQNYPNPFNPTTTIEFTLPEDGRVRLKIYNMLGQEVTTLVDEDRKAGIYQQVIFDASRLATGTYISRLEFKDKALVKKLLLVK